jgi:mitogen-activated protein kinase organizer 1
MGSYGLECSFSYDDSCILSGSEDGRVVVWDMVTKDVSQSFQAHANNKAVRSIASHPTEDLLLTASVDSTVRVWVAK